MSTSQAIPAEQTDRSPKAQRLVEYLHDKVQDENGECYIKGKFIADDVGLSTKEIGMLLYHLQDEVEGLDIEKWSYTAATTWRISAC